MQLSYNIKDDNSFVISFSGKCNSALDVARHNDILRQISVASNIFVNGEDIEEWSTIFIALLYEIFSVANEKGLKIEYSLPNSVEALIKLAFADNRKPTKLAEEKIGFIERIGLKIISMHNACSSGWNFLKEVFGSVKRFFSGKAIMRKIDFLFALEDCSFKAFGIVFLISFMVGLIFGFVGAMQLELFGAEIFIASLVMISMTRVMGAIMTGIIMSGRTGSAYAATIGTMQVNEEIDALKTMGINVIDFLLLPRMLALIITMPILTVFADIAGVIGGSIVGIFMLDLAPSEYWKYSVEALSLNNFLIGILHGAVFGVLIALCGCYYGIKSGKDADSVGNAATRAVVASIVWIVVLTAVLTAIFQVIGI